MINSNRFFTTPVSPLRFFVLTFFLSWLIWIPLTLSHFGIAFNIPEATSIFIRLLGVLVPAIAALILTGVSGEKGAVLNLLSRLTVWRVGWVWWGAAGLVYPMLLVISALINNSFGSHKVVSEFQNTGTIIVNIIFLAIAVLGEEIGWHGVALPAMQQRYQPLKASLILGACWGIWHLPFWMLLDTFTDFGFFYLLLNLLFVFPMTIFATWFFNLSRYSLLLPVVFHLTFNIVNTTLLPVTLSLGAFGILIVFSWIIMFIVMPYLNPPPTT